MSVNVTVAKSSILLSADGATNSRRFAQRRFRDAKSKPLTTKRMVMGHKQLNGVQIYSGVEERVAS
jgi:hypothetical protein